MSFLWPQTLWLLLTLPALVGLYVWLLRRRKQIALRYANLALVRSALSPGQHIRRHLPPFVFLLALLALIVAVARPTATITLPTEQRTIILAIDVSLSMRASDIEPSRIEAAREAAKAFVKEQPSDVRIGVVAFAGSAAVAQQPTQDREDIIAAIDQLQLQVHTAIGSGIIVSLATLFPDDAITLEEANLSGSTGSGRIVARSLDREPKSESKPFVAARPGSNRSMAIILLTDGRRTIGPDPLDAARLAADRGVKVYTVGFGKVGGGSADVEGVPIYMRFDEETLKSVAELTAAEYFQAGSATDLKQIYERLNARYVLERKETEITSLVSAVAAVLMVLAGGLSVLWFSRIT